VRRRSARTLAAVGLALALGLAGAVSPYASGAPDGLERVAADHGFDHRARTPAVQEAAPMPAYAFPGIGNERVAAGVGGFAGTLGVFALASGLTAVLRHRRAPAQARRAPAPSA
jgi:hypothetical protein